MIFFFFFPFFKQIIVITFIDMLLFLCSWWLLYIAENEAGSVGEKEWYFFCRRVKKYKNSVRPNRVTGSGFWKATGIDKAIYSVKEPHECIGLKKSLVYYRGSAGKGTKTDWMMHEFRLPASKSTNPSVTKNTTQEAVRFI